MSSSCRAASSPVHVLRISGDGLLVMRQSYSRSGLGEGGVKRSYDVISRIGRLGLDEASSELRASCVEEDVSSSVGGTRRISFTFEARFNSIVMACK